MGKRNNIAKKGQKAWEKKAESEIGNGESVC